MITRALILVLVLSSCLKIDAWAQDTSDQATEVDIAELESVMATILGDTISVRRTVGDTLGLELLMVEDTAILRWRPREFDPNAPQPQIDLRAAMGVLPLFPVAETAIIESETPAAVAVLIDVGPTISGEEVGAYLFHAQSLVTNMPTSVDVAIQPLDAEMSFMPFTRDVLEMQSQLESLRKSDIPSTAILSALRAGVETADFGAIRGAVYILTDASSCASEGPWAPEELAGYHSEYGVIFNVALFTDTSPSDQCLQSLVALVETSGGAFYPIGQRGDHPYQPLSSIAGVVGGGEIVYELGGYTRLPHEPEEVLFRVGMQLNGRSAEFALPRNLPATDWVTAIQILTAVHGLNVALSIIGIAVFIGLIALIVGMRRQSVRAWITPMGTSADPQPIYRGGLVLKVPGSKDIRLREKGPGRVRVWGGVVSVNGADTSDTLIEDGDVFELSGGERFRLHLPGKASS